MKIVADANIVHIEQLYQHHGELVLKSGRDIAAEDVRDAEVLVVRSITKVNRSLLAGSKVRLVLTATSGTDHLDLEYLAQAGICVKDAAGSNANAVVEYCLSAMSELILGGKLELQKAKVGIVGFGHVGSRLYRALTMLGVECVVCDPYVQSAGGFPEDLEPVFCSFDQVLKCSIISFHTPLERAGSHPSYHLINRQTLAKIRPGSLLINAARGAVIDNQALYARLKSDADLHCVLDVWESEPNLHQGLLDRVDLGTPHIAGYSVEAKTKASQMNFAAFENFFSLSSAGKKAAVKESLIPVEPCDAILSKDSDERILAKCLVGAFPVRAIDAQLRACTKSDAVTFDAIRKQMTDRREFAKLSFDLALLTEGSISPELGDKLKRLGFAFEAR